jgi:FkbM family methyltransferase
LFIAKQNSLVRYFGDMDRGFDSYGKNIMTRSSIIDNSYCLQNINFSSEDIVIDCGANYGDLFIGLSKKIPEQNYIAFEPGPIEYQCLLNSLPNSRIFNLGLSDKDGELEFYLCSKTADSSVVRPKSFTDIVKTKVTSMDSILPSLQINKCKLFKLEAEGWEPEILNGAREFMKICEYIAIDGSPERGIEEKITFHTLNNDLLKSGFEMVDIYGESYRALYKNLSFSEH